MGKHSGIALFVLDDFRPYIRAWAESQGRGEFRRIALALNIHTTLVSQIVGGSKCLTEEQAVRLCSHMKLSQLESDYFLKLVQIERAGTEELKTTLTRHLGELRINAGEIKSRVPRSKGLTEKDRALFYSSWQYGLIRLLTSIEAYETPEAIARRLQLPLSRVQDVLDFLVARNLCNEKGGRFKRTSDNTHVESRSALSIRHHQNWRGRTIELHEHLRPQDLVFTAPVSLSKKDADKIRSILLEAISDMSELISQSPAEQVYYVGIDWVEL